MASSKILSTLRRTRPGVVDCFRSAQLYRRSATCPPAGSVVVLFTWLGAKEKYAHKYARCWNDRGHDVLHVTTSVRDLLMPKTGSEVTAQRVVDFLDRYNQPAIVHGLSVGGYLTQRVLMAAQDSVPITHQIYDSFTSCVGMVAGVQNAVSPRYRTIATIGAKLYVKYGDLSSTYEAQRFVLTTPCPAPGLYIHSLADQVTRYPDMECIVQAHSRTSPVTAYLVPEQEQVKHVSILRYLGEHKYMALIDDFVAKYKNFVSNKNQDYRSSFVLKYISENTNPCPDLAISQ